MSTLEVSNLNDGTTTVATTFVTNGSAKAWVNLDGTGTATLRDTLNITSVTDDGTGRYDFSITNAMSSTNYVINASGRQDETAPFTGVAVGVDTESSSVVHVSCRLTSGSLADQEILCCSLQGDLA